MSEPEPSVPRSRFLRRILTGWFYVAVFGALWWQWGAWVILFALGWIVIATAIWLASKLLPRRRPNADQVDLSNLHERVFLPAPVEAAVARSRLGADLFAGSLWLVFISSLLAGFTGAPFLIVLVAVTLSAICTAAMILVWAISRAKRRNQFSIATLLILITLSAVYLGVIRLLVILSGEPLGAADAPFLTVAVACFVMVGFSLPLLLVLMVRLVWLAAWLVRRPGVRRWLRGTRRSGS